MASTEPPRTRDVTEFTDELVPDVYPSVGASRTSSLWFRALASRHWIAVVLLALIALFSALNFEAFLTVDNFRSIIVDVSVLLVMAVGATFVLITAGVDLSVGSVLVFSGVVGAKLMESIGGNGLGTVMVGLVACVSAGAAWGVFNGLVITKLRIPPLIATLGTLGMALGLAQVITDGVDVRRVPTLLGEYGTARLFGELPLLALTAGLVALVGGLILATTRFGRHTYAIGSNVEAARRAGINVERHLLMVYGAAGALSGLAGFMSLGRFTTTTLAGHTNDILEVISGVVLGGTSLFGGVGTMLGTVIGMFIPAVLRNGLIVAGTQPFWQQVVVGGVLILAVYFDQLRRTRS